MFSCFLQYVQAPKPSEVPHCSLWLPEVVTLHLAARNAPPGGDRTGYPLAYSTISTWSHLHLHSTHTHTHTLLITSHSIIVFRPWRPCEGCGRRTTMAGTLSFEECGEEIFIGGNFNQVLVRFKCEFSQLSISEERRKLKWLMNCNKRRGFYLISLLSTASLLRPDLDIREYSMLMQILAYFIYSCP